MIDDGVSDTPPSMAVTTPAFGTAMLVIIITATLITTLSMLKSARSPSSSPPKDSPPAPPEAGDGVVVVGESPTPLSLPSLPVQQPQPADWLRALLTAVVTCKPPNEWHKVAAAASQRPAHCSTAHATGALAMRARTVDKSVTDRDEAQPLRFRPRYVWSTLSESEAAHVAALRADAAADEELQRFLPGFDAALMPDDELVRFLIDCDPPFDRDEGLEALRVAAKARAENITFPLPMERGLVDSWSHVARFDGTTRDGESVFFVVFSRTLQDALAMDAEPFLVALIGLMDRTRREYFREGEMETVQTVVQVERGFNLSPRALAAFVRATHRVMGALTEMYPSLTSRILVVNLPGSLAWFVRLVKGFLCEASGRKIELINDFDALHDHYDEAGLPSYYRERGGISP